jgi:hypothetical protein
MLYSMIDDFVRRGYFVPVCDVSPFCQHACDEYVIYTEDAAIALLVHLNI